MRVIESTKKCFSTLSGTVLVATMFQLTASQNELELKPADKNDTNTSWFGYDENSKSYVWSMIRSSKGSNRVVDMRFGRSSKTDNFIQLFSLNPDSRDLYESLIYEDPLVNENVLPVSEGSLRRIKRSNRPLQFYNTIRKNLKNFEIKDYDEVTPEIAHQLCPERNRSTETKRLLSARNTRGDQDDIICKHQQSGINCLDAKILFKNVDQKKFHQFLLSFDAVKNGRDNYLPGLVGINNSLTALMKPATEGTSPSMAGGYQVTSTADEKAEEMQFQKDVLMALLINVYNSLPEGLNFKARSVPLSLAESLADVDEQKYHNFLRGYKETRIEGYPKTRETGRVGISACLDAIYENHAAGRALYDPYSSGDPQLDKELERLTLNEMLLRDFRENVHHSAYLVPGSFESSLYADGQQDTMPASLSLVIAQMGSSKTLDPEIINTEILEPEIINHDLPEPTPKPAPMFNGLTADDCLKDPEPTPFDAMEEDRKSGGRNIDQWRRHIDAQTSSKMVVKDQHMTREVETPLY